MIISLTLCYEARSQKLLLDFESGIGSYSMSGLKKLNTKVAAAMPFNSKLVSNFPLNWYLRQSVLLKYEFANIGLNYVYQSTASEISGKDNSGEFNSKLEVNSHCPGIFSNAYIYLLGNFMFSVDVSAGVIFSNLKKTDYERLNDSIITNENLIYKAFSYYFEPGLNLKYKYKLLYFGLNAGYFVTIGKAAFYRDHDKQKKLYDTFNGSSIHPNWNGFRFGLSVAYYFHRKTLLKPDF